MRKLTKERWMDIRLGMEPHLKEIARIVSQAGMDMTTIAATDSGRAWATYIDAEDGKHYSVDIRPDGVSELSIDCKVFYTKN
ncbi:hypothetical protein [[Clostridium] scindens]|uniref:hypothetical protein n=1 Tax=Clostridium scindens (strain JCM 10418 / VPI 12708) TaxID=29347 RepID=UPI00298D5E6D|nr:hypothetical protein [[Clostridium] scindens]